MKNWKDDWFSREVWNVTQLWREVNGLPRMPEPEDKTGKIIPFPKRKKDDDERE